MRHNKYVLVGMIIIYFNSVGASMRIFKQNKLWRDKAVDMMEQNHGSKINWRYLNDAEFDEQIRLKLLEEAQEAALAKDRKELMSELADLYEVIDTLVELHAISKNEIIEMQTKKREERGGFSGRCFVDTAEHVEGGFGEEYCLADPLKYPEIVAKSVESR